MTKTEAKQWYDNVPEEEIIQFLIEWNELKQALCAQTLAIPTGTDDWIVRSIRRAEQLRECERQLRRLINTESELLEDVIWKTRHRECFNCQGAKLVHGESCVICNGTGLHTI